MIGDARMTFDEQVATRTLAQESRGEPLEGQQAVAHVLVNRLKSGRWGSSFASVCLWHAQFSGWWSPRGNPSIKDPNFLYACSLKDDDATLDHMLSVLNAAITRTSDPTNGAMWYYAESMPKAPDWVQGATFCSKFGHQLFYKGVK